MKWTNVVVSSVVSALLVLPGDADMPPNPNPFRMTQPDGTETTLMYLRGGAEYSWETDEKGFVVTRDPDTKEFVYTKKNQSTGRLEKTGCKVGRCDPRKANLQPNELPDEEVIMDECGKACRRPRGERLNPTLQRMKLDRIKRAQAMNELGEDDERRLQAPTAMKNLVVMVRFKDHQTRTLPSKSDFDKLFNKIGGDSVVAPTGSVRDVFLYNSYQKFDLVSTVYDWITLPETEAYYADNNYGMSGKLSEGLKYALQKIDDDPNFNYKNFDGDNDGRIDAIAFLHSGYGAEWGGQDCYTKATNVNRIWSHKWSLSGGRFLSNDGVSVSAYHISPGLWSTCGTSIGRIGVIAHETGHYLGLPDLYDGTGGSGIGSYSLMANSWGFDGSQRYPPMMDPWSKIFLGWMKSTEITTEGHYQLPASYSAPDVYIIKNGYAADEYLLIENRQPDNKFESKLPQGGLAIWHIDEKASYTNEGYPGQAGWPGNGNHYRVALLQADGGYDLELGKDRGDSYDLFHGSSVDSIGPEGVTAGMYPNTDSYRYGTIVKTGHKIHDISASASTMSFCLGSCSGPPVQSPVSAPVKLAVQTEFLTTMVGGNGQCGNMFDIYAKNTIEVQTFDIHVDIVSSLPVKVYTKSGSYKGYETNPAAWTLMCDGTVPTLGIGQRTPIPVALCKPITVSAGETRSFYVTLTQASLDYTNGQQEGALFAENADIAFLEGVGNRCSFTTFYAARIFNGVIRYTVGGQASVGAEEFYPSGGDGPAFAGVSQGPKDGKADAVCERDEDCESGTCVSGTCSGGDVDSGDDDELEECGGNNAECTVGTDCCAFFVCYDGKCMTKSKTRGKSGGSNGKGVGLSDMNSAP